MEFNNKSIKKFMDVLLESTKELADKHGVIMELAGGSIDGYSVTVKIKISDQKRQFENECSIYGFDAEDFLREFVREGERFRLHGFNNRARTRPCLCTNLDNGKEYVFPINAVKEYFGKK